MLQMAVFPKYNNLALHSVDLFLEEEKIICLILVGLDFYTILVREKIRDLAFNQLFNQFYGNSISASPFRQ